MVARDLVLAQLTGARYHVAPISTLNAVAMVAYARQHALPVTCEAPPHHFALTDADMAPYDNNSKMKPPLRSCAHRDAIVDGLAAGTISAIASDHAPNPESEKVQEFERWRVRHHRPGNGECAGAGRTDGGGEDHPGAPGGVVHHGSGRGDAVGPRQAGAGRGGRRDRSEERRVGKECRSRW